MLTAGLQNIPDELYEAAAIDGAGIWQQVRHDHAADRCGRSTRCCVLVLFLWTFNDFNTPFVLFGSRRRRSPPTSSRSTSTSSSFVTWNFGLGSAMSVLLLLFLLVVTGRLPAAHRREGGHVDA